MPSFSRLSHHKGLPRLLAAQIPADLADWLDFVAVGALLAFVWNAGPLAFAWLAVAFGLPYLVIGPFAGAWVDRADLKQVLLLSNAGRALMTLALAFSHNVTILLAIVFLRGAADCFFTPARQASIQALVPTDDLMAANGLSHAINQISKIAGPAAGGILLVFFAPQQLFVINALVSAMAVLILAGLHRDLRPVKTGSGQQSLLRDIGDALAELRVKPVLSYGLLLMAAGFFAMFLYDTLIPLLVKASGFDETIYGMSIAAVGTGGVLGSLALGAWAGHRRPFVWIACGCLASAAVVLFLGLSDLAGTALRPVLFVFLFAILGAATSAMIVPFRTIIQAFSTPDRIARISALGEATTNTALLIAPFAGAALANATSVAVSFVVGGAMMTALALAAVLMAVRFRSVETG